MPRWKLKISFISCRLIRHIIRLNDHLLCGLPVSLSLLDRIWVKKNLDKIWVNFIKLSRFTEELKCMFCKGASNIFRPPFSPLNKRIFKKQLLRREIFPKCTLDTECRWYYTQSTLLYCCSRESKGGHMIVMMFAISEQRFLHTSVWIKRVSQTWSHWHAGCS